LHQFASYLGVEWLDDLEMVPIWTALLF
jgi:hypothetical protein